MARTIEKTGKSVEDALNEALLELGVGKDDVDVEVLESPSKGIFGIFGTKPARIKVSLKEVDAPSPEKNTGAPATIVSFQFVQELSTLPKVDDDEEIESETVTEIAPTVVVLEPFDRKKVIDAARKFLSDVFSAMKVDVTMSLREVDSNVIIDLSEKNSAFLIGTHGQTLDALQYLTNLAANRASEEKVRFILDVENYRERREEILKKMARSAAERAVHTRQEVKMEVMSRHERRIIHTTLQDNRRVETQSVGEEPYRYVVVSPKKKS
ncbi:MAG: protein jag [Selenomonadaceae bacterium]|nr:protein jag [Selenomonadaceae bacterium]